MKKNYLSGIFVLFTFLGYGQLIISQYTETNSGTTPKGIELWNVSGSQIDFSVTALDIEIGVNGGAPSSVFSLNSGTLDDGDVLVVGTEDMSGTVSGGGTCGIYQEETFTFNGDDAIVIKLNGTITDVFGNPGEDPGSAWSGGGVSTANSNIQLKTGILTGDTNGWTDPSERFENVAVGSILTGFGTPPGGCGGPTCGISDLDVVSSDCSGINPGDDDTYELVISYFGTDPDAFVSFTGSGTVTYGSIAGNLNGTDIVISDIPETEDWMITITGGECDIDFSGLAPSCDPVPAVIINEIDADNEGTDTEEFIELAGPAGASLDGFVLVLFNGSTDGAYDAIDLDGHNLDENGFFVIGSDLVPNVDLVAWVSNGIQNGADGVGLYYGLNDSDFPGGTPVSSNSAFLVDGAVYDTDDPDDPGLLAVLDSEQTNENENNMATTQSIQRNSPAPPKWIVAGPTPGAENISAPLPVELVYFEAKLMADRTRLQWATAQELNNDHFILEHSVDGRIFQPFAKVDGSGTSPEMKEYAYDHHYVKAGKSYYRLKQVDLDGSHSYSPVRVLVREGTNTIRIMPTLVADRLNVLSDQATGYIFRVMNVDGKIIHQEEVIDQADHMIDLSLLQQGLYFVEILTTQQRLLEKIYKL